MADYVEVKPFFSMQALKSFMKAKNDWMEFSKFHLSFVQHEGKPTCKQVQSIEGSLKFYGADGALYLCNLVLSGAAKKMVAASKAEAEKNGSKYAKPIFSSIGGTVAKRSKNGVATFRQFTVEPGMKTEYVIKMMTCEGVEGAMGGIQPKEGAQRSQIIVPFTSGDMVCFAQAMLSEYEAYRSFTMISGSTTNVMKPDHTASVDEPNRTTFNDSDGAVEQPAVEVKVEYSDGPVYVLLDKTGVNNSGNPVVMRQGSVENVLQEWVKKLLYTANLKAVPDSYKSAIELIKEGKHQNHSICFFEKGGNPDEIKGEVSLCIMNIV